MHGSQWSANVLICLIWTFKGIARVILGPNWLGLISMALHGRPRLAMASNGFGWSKVTWAFNDVRLRPMILNAHRCLANLPNGCQRSSVVSRPPRKIFYKLSKLKIIDSEAQWFPAVSSRSTGTNGSRGSTCPFQLAPQLPKYPRRL